LQSVKAQMKPVVDQLPPIDKEKVPDVINKKIKPKDKKPNNKLVSDEHIALLKFYYSPAEEKEINREEIRKNAENYAKIKLNSIQGKLGNLVQDEVLLETIKRLKEIKAEREVLSKQISQAENVAEENRPKNEEFTKEYNKAKGEVKAASDFIKMYNEMSPEEQKTEEQNKKMADDLLEEYKPIRDKSAKGKKDSGGAVEKSRNIIADDLKEKLKLLTKESSDIERDINAIFIRNGVYIKENQNKKLRSEQINQSFTLVDIPEEKINQASNHAAEEVFTKNNSNLIKLNRRNIKIQIKQLPGLIGEDYSITVVKDRKTGRDRLLALYKGDSKIMESEDNKNSNIGGEGAFGKVKYAQDIETGEWFAYKVLKKATLEKGKDEEDKLDLGQQLKGGIARSSSKKSSYEIVMKLVPGEPLDKYLAENKLDVNSCKKFLGACCEAINALHKQGVVHCDIKSDNLLFDKKTQEAGPVDFGLSVMNNTRIKGDLKGSPNFIAPELLVAHRGQREINYNVSNDVYSLGIALAKSLGLTEESELAKKIKGDVGSLPGKTKEQVPIRTGLLNITDNPEIIAKSAIGHLPENERNEIITLLKGMASPSPSKRISLTDAMEKIAAIKITEERTEEKSNAVFKGANNSPDQSFNAGSIHALTSSGRYGLFNRANSHLSLNNSTSEEPKKTKSDGPKLTSGGD